jgi:competence protein ComEC
VTAATAGLLLAAAWAGALAGSVAWVAAEAVAATGVVCAGGLMASHVWRHRGDRPGRTVLLAACLLIAAATWLGAAVRTAAIEAGPLAQMADGRAGGVAVEVRGTAVTDVRAPPDGRRWVLLRLDHLVQAGDELVTPSRERILLRLPGPGTLPTLGGRYVATGLVERIDGPAGEGLRRLGVVLALGAVEVEPVGDPPGWLRATSVLRDRLRRAAATHLGPAEASLLTGLVTGDLTGQPDEVEADVLAAGLSHLVAVSGSNVALVVGGVLALALPLGVARRWAWVLALVAVWWFVVLARAEPSVVRAAVMASLVLGSLLIGRRRSTPQLVCTAGTLVLLTDPLLARRLGFVLSMAATAGVVLLAPSVDAALRRHLPRPAGLRRILAATIGAQLAVAPILALSGGVAHPAGVPANLVAVPAAAAATVVGTVTAGVAILWPDAGGGLAVAARPALAVVLWSARTFADSTVRDVVAAATAAGGLVLAVAVLGRAGQVAPVVRRIGVGALPAGALAVIVIGGPAPWAAPGHRLPDHPVLAVLDVGQGDAVLVGDPVGGWVLVDGGPDPDVVLARLGEVGVRSLVAAVATHPHADHVDGLVGVLDAVPVGVLLIGPSHGYAELLAAAGAADVEVRQVVAGDGWRLGGTTLEVLSPPPTGLGEANESSVVLRVDAGGGSALLTGDSERVAQTLLRDDPRIDVDVLKVPHHGGATNAAGFLAATSPHTAVISVGADNDFGHPHPDVLADLSQIVVRRTDLHGTVEIPLGPP